MLRRSRFFSILFVFALLFSAWTRAASAAEPSTYIWVEAEDAEEINFEHNTGAARSHLLSGEQWVQTALNQQAVEQMPEGGFRLRCAMRVPERGTYEAWARVGMEWIRAPFEWRIGEGEWRPGPADRTTTNVMELTEWNEVAWLYLGDVQLDRGRTELTIRYTETQSDRNDMQIALDCFAFTKGHFVPEGKLKPGETYDDELDRQAADQVYQFPEAAGPAERTELELSGLWQVARYDDPDMDVGTYVPVQELPSADEYPLRWMGAEVPGSVWDIEETIFAHRVIFRTRVDVPAGYEGRGFKLHFSGTNWIVSVFVNGELAGSHRGVWIPWDLDVSDHVRPGETNEIAVAVKGPYYAVDIDNYGRGNDLDRTRNRPKGRQNWVFFVAPIYPSSKGDGSGVEYGIVNPVTMTAVGDAYTEDVFIKPGLDRYGRNKRLETDVTVRNTGDQSRTFEVKCEAVDDRTGELAKEFEPATLCVPPGETKSVRIAANWSDPKLWWPVADPNLYRLRTTISEDGTALDVQEELFGFRWVQVKDTGLYINGVRRNVWNWVDVQGRPWDGETWVEQFRKENNRFTRFSQNRKTSGFLKSREERLEFYDRNGIPGRLCSMIDGMFINRYLGEKVNSPVTGEPTVIPNKPVWDGFKRHMRQLAKAYRNHPSVIMYQVENELVYITGMNMGYDLDDLEELMGDVVEEARAVDPTRPYTVGGAGDLSCRCEINSPHYPLGSLDWYPENAYTLEKYSSKIQNWPWKRQKPWIVGESLFASHLRLGSYALGDEAFRSARDAQRGKARFLRAVYGGYRWAGAAGFFPWDNLHGFEDADKVFSALYAVPRKQTSRLFAGRENNLAFKIMNDTLSDEPVTLSWSYEAGGDQVASGEQVAGGDQVAEGEKNMRIKPGFGQEVALKINAPETDERLEGMLRLTVSQEGAEDYTDERSVPVLPVVSNLELSAPCTVFDRSGRVPEFLEDVGMDFEEIDDLAALEGRTGLLVVGPDTLTAEEALGRDLLKFAGQGGRVVVLEQDVPAAGANLPAPVRTTTHSGGYAHPQALGTPVFRDLGKDDLIDWAGEHPVYKHVYEKPSQGARSLAEAGPMLPYSALVEMPAGQGVIVACQLRVGANLRQDPAADVLLRNLLEYYSGYRPASGVAAVYTPDDPLLMDKVRETGALMRSVGSVREALDPEKFQVALIHATEANLKALTDLGDRARAFQKAGGWIVLNGLGPDGIQEFNKLVGIDHMIRPFRMERVTLESANHPLAATLGNRDVTLYSPQHLQHSKDWISMNTYTHVVDGLDVAPFTRPPGAPEDIMVYEPTRDDKDPYNFVNGMLGSDHWRYIRQIWVPEDGAEPLVFQFRRPERIAKVRVWNNTNYWTIEDLDIIFDGDEDTAVRMTLPDSGAMTELELSEPRRVEESITLQIRSWRVRRTDQRLVGIDNVQFLRPATPGNSVFIDSVGGLVAYPHGEGGVFLNQVKFMAKEPRPENRGKKLNMMGVVLQNMGVGSRTARVAVPGVNLRYEPLDLTDYGTQYLSYQEGKGSIFGAGQRDLRNLQVGEQVMADVLYHLVDYSTAPVPDCIVLGAEGAPDGMPKTVEGIPVGRKADVLFFLHTANVRRGLRGNEEPPEVLRYVVHYADGATANIPVRLGVNIEHWLQQTPTLLEGALIGTTIEVPDVGDRKGVLYSMQVDNPRPDAEIQSIDVRLGEATNRAVPAVLGITVADVLD